MLTTYRHDTARPLAAHQPRLYRLGNGGIIRDQISWDGVVLPPVGGRRLGVGVYPGVLEEGEEDPAHGRVQREYLAHPARHERV